jgi:hypothetical protein
MPRRTWRATDTVTCHRRSRHRTCSSGGAARRPSCVRRGNAGRSLQDHAPARARWTRRSVPRARHQAGPQGRAQSRPRARARFERSGAALSLRSAFTDDGSMFAVVDPSDTPRTYSGDMRPIWYAPLLLPDRGELITHRGWQKLDGSTPSDEHRWRKRLEGEVRLADASADSAFSARTRSPASSSSGTSDGMNVSSTFRRNRSTPFARAIALASPSRGHAHISTSSRARGSSSPIKSTRSPSTTSGHF